MKSLILGLLVACHHDPAPAIAPPPPPPPAKPIDAPAPADEAQDFTSTTGFLEEAFGGALPTLPSLSKDGASVAVDLSEQRTGGYWRTFDVGFYTKADAPDSHAVIFDTKAADAANEGGHYPPIASIAALAKPLVAQLASYHPFPTRLERGQLDAGKVPFGKLTLAIAAGPKGLDLAWQKQKLHIAVRPRAEAEGGACGGVPQLTDVWFDEPSSRLVMRIVFPGHDSCIDEPILWHVF